MMLTIAVAFFTLVQGLRVDASMNLLPILRGTKYRTPSHSLTHPAVQSVSDDLEALPENDSSEFLNERSNNVVGDVTNNYNNDVTHHRDIHTPFPHMDQVVSDAQIKDAIDSVVLDLFVKFAKQEMEKTHRQQQQQQHTDEPISKRLWGQRRNGPTRIASFGTKLSPSRKMLLGSSGSTLLRYGRSAGPK